MTKKMTVSRAKDAYTFLLSVKKAIQAEPRRVTMHCFVLDKPDDFADRPRRLIPPCGTAGCFAGMINFKSGAYAVRKKNGIAADDAEAVELLGGAKYGTRNRSINYMTVTDKEGEGAEYVFNSGEGDACEDTEPGTKAHAKAVLARIDRFMAVNKVALKARKLEFRDGQLHPIESVSTTF